MKDLNNSSLTNGVKQCLHQGSKTCLKKDLKIVP